MSKSGNKGFSLIELIIVIAIMAVLVGFIVPQYIKYVDKSRLANDKQLITAIHNALAAAIVDENIADRPLGGIAPIDIELLDNPGAGYYSAYTDFVDTFKSFVQVDSTSSLKDHLKSKEYKGQDILIEINGTTQQVKVTVEGNGGADDFVVE